MIVMGAAEEIVNSAAGASRNVRNHVMADLMDEGRRDRARMMRGVEKNERMLQHFGDSVDVKAA